MIPRLMPCSSSPPPGRDQQQEQVDHVGDRDLGLADADGLDDHDVEAGRLAQQHRLAGAPGHAAELVPPGEGRMNASGWRDELGHAGLVAEDRAAGARARRVDGEHRDPVAERRRCAARAPR